MIRRDAFARAAEYAQPLHHSGQTSGATTFLARRPTTLSETDNTLLRA
ncbi:hypothetical protein [Streptomyces xanthophaeus]